MRAGTQGYQAFSSALQLVPSFNENINYILQKYLKTRQECVCIHKREEQSHMLRLKGACVRQILQNSA